jgi:hypothetical protein
MARLIIAVLFFAFPLGAQQPQPLPDAPKPKPEVRSSHLNPRIFWTGVSLLAASKTADAISTRRLLNDGGWETNSIYGREPSPGRQAGINAAFFAGQISLFYLTERSSNRYIRWAGRTYIGLQVANHSKLTAGNIAVTGVPGKHAHSLLPGL